MPTIVCLHSGTSSSAFGHDHDHSDPQTMVLDKVGSFSQVLRCSPRAWSLGQWALARSAAKLTCWGRSAEYAHSDICSLSTHSQRAVGWSPIFLRCWWSLQCPVQSPYIVTWVFLSSWWSLQWSLQRPVQSQYIVTWAFLSSWWMLSFSD
jgi:hypothetical protein